jgi:hypothetical protein
MTGMDEARIRAMRNIQEFLAEKSHRLYLLRVFHVSIIIIVNSHPPQLN